MTLRTAGIGEGGTDGGPRRDDWLVVGIELAPGGGKTDKIRLGSRVHLFFDKENTGQKDQKKSASDVEN